MALCDALAFAERRGVPGAVVECGVWRGGSMMAAARCLLGLGATGRDLHLYDTFGAVPEPEARDRHRSGAPAAEIMRAAEREDPTLGQLGAERVRELVVGTGYPPERVHLHPGRVEETIPADAPERIAVCRLDTDWYASTAHELRHLYPRIAPGGVLIVDDYGEFSGAQEAVDEFLATLDDPPLLTRIDASARIGLVGV